jgi:hypothetical protein
LHDVVQLTGGELPNKVRRSAAADAHDGNALRKHYFQRDSEHDVYDGLQFVAACMSDELRPAVSFAVNKYPLPLRSGEYHLVDQRRIVGVCLRAIDPFRNWPALQVIVRGWLQIFHSRLPA